MGKIEQVSAEFKYLSLKNFSCFAGQNAVNSLSAGVSPTSYLELTGRRVGLLAYEGREKTGPVRQRE